MHSLLFSQIDSLVADLWSSTSWTDIDEIRTISGEVEQVITTAGVRGDEAEEDILKYLWYRKRSIREYE